MNLSGRFTSRMRVAQRSLRSRPTTLRLCANQTRSLLTVQAPLIKNSTLLRSTNTPSLSTVQLRTFADKAAKAAGEGEVGEESGEETTEPNKTEEASADEVGDEVKRKMEEKPYEFCEESKVETSTENTEGSECKSSSEQEQQQVEPASEKGFLSGMKNMFGFKEKEKRESSPGESEEIAELHAKIKELEKQSNGYKNAALELKADVFNVRKRGLKDVENAQKFAVEKFAKEMLVIADNIDLALKNVEKPVPEETHKDFVTLYESMEMTQKTITTVFTKFDVQKVESLGLKFDYNIHEVLFQMPGEEGEEPGLIKNVVRDGYWLKGRALRSAQVGVVQN